MKKLIQSLVKNVNLNDPSVRQAEKAVESCEQMLEKSSKHLKRYIKLLSETAEEGEQVANSTENFAYVVSQQFPEWALLGSVLQKTSTSEIKLDSIRKQTATELTDQVYHPWSDLLSRDLTQQAKDAKSRYDKLNLEPDVEARMILNDLAMLCEYEIMSKLCNYFGALQSYYKRSLEVVDLTVTTLVQDTEKKRTDYDKIRNMQHRSLQSNFKTFGEPLCNIVSRDGSTIPLFIEKALAHLRNYAYLEGILRISGGRAQVTLLKCQIDQGFDIDYSATDPFVLGHLVKQFLRELPEPLLTHQYYQSFLDIGANDSFTPDEAVEKIKGLVRRLPGVNQQLLKVFLEFLYMLSENAEKNKMNISNLATVVTPNILYSNREDFGSFSAANRVMELMITYHKLLFPDNEEITEIHDELGADSNVPQVELASIPLEGNVRSQKHSIRSVASKFPTWKRKGKKESIEDELPTVNISGDNTTSSSVPASPVEERPHSSLRESREVLTRASTLTDVKGSYLDSKERERDYQNFVRPSRPKKKEERPKKQLFSYITIRKKKDLEAIDHETQELAKQELPISEPLSVRHVTKDSALLSSAITDTSEPNTPKRGSHDTEMPSEESSIKAGRPIDTKLHSEVNSAPASTLATPQREQLHNYKSASFPSTPTHISTSLAEDTRQLEVKQLKEIVLQQQIQLNQIQEILQQHLGIKLPKSVSIASSRSVSRSSSKSHLQSEDDNSDNEHPITKNQVSSQAELLCAFDDLSNF